MSKTIMIVGSGAGNSTAVAAGRDQCAIDYRDYNRAHEFLRG